MSEDVQLSKVVDGVMKEVIIFISRSRHTRFLSVVEYPTTLLMAYCHELHVWMLYFSFYLILSFIFHLLSNRTR